MERKSDVQVFSTVRLSLSGCLLLMGYRILVLGDHKHHIAALKEAAAAAGHEVLALGSVEECMSWLKTQDHVDVIVCHAFLQNDDAIEFLKSVKRDRRFRWIQFILVSCESSEMIDFLNASVKDASLLLGADKYVMMHTFSVNRLMKEIEASFPDMPPRSEQDNESLGDNR